MTFDISKIDSLYYTMKTVRALFPEEVQFSVTFEGNQFDYSGINITSGQTLPPEEEFLQKLQEIYEQTQAQVAATQYQRDRAKKYPELSELIVALWEKLVEGRSEKADELQALRQAIKDEYPKP